MLGPRVCTARWLSRSIYAWSRRIHTHFRGFRTSVWDGRMLVLTLLGGRLVLFYLKSQASSTAVACSPLSSHHYLAISSGTRPRLGN